MRQITLDALHLTEKKEAHLYLQEQFAFPEYYGMNLDALFDCLTELEETSVQIKNGKNAGGYFDKIRRVFEAAARENDDLIILANYDEDIDGFGEMC